MVEAPAPAPAPVVEAPAPAPAPEVETPVQVSSGERDIASDFANQKEDIQQSPDRKVRHSVMAHDPDALRRIVHEDPKVAEAVELFNGTVIDMHVM